MPPLIHVILIAAQLGHADTRMTEKQGIDTMLAGDDANMRRPQIFVHELLVGEHISKRQLKGRRGPYHGAIQSDWIMEKLSSGRA